jgi:SAM-dependent methyltransferase
VPPASGPWRRDTAGFVEARLPGPPARVLEVGCGDGWLCHHLAGTGYDVRGIDPEAPEDPLLVPVALEDFDDHGSFDAVVASLSLHHMTDLGRAIEKIADALRASGTVVIVEFAWDRFDDDTARWCLERLPLELDQDNWLHERCVELRQRHARGEPLQASELMHRWAAEERFHSSSEMLEALRSRFSECFFEWSPYLYPDLADVSADEEAAAMEAGEIAPSGFRFVGVVRT